MPEISLRSVTKHDAILLHSLARECPPLLLHTHYTYWVQAAFFGGECFIAELDHNAVGFITSVTARDRQLIWQIGVLPDHRGQGYSRLLIDRVVQSAIDQGRERIEFSIAKENVASTKAFKAYADRNGLIMNEIGELHLTDPLNPNFSEKESVYMLSLPSTPKRTAI